jgi:hypothetical protein
MKLKHLVLLSALVASGISVRATSVVPPTFDELVDQAEVIFQGDVTDVKSQWIGEGAQRVIVSYVTFKVEDAVKGNAGQTYTIRMLGGTVGEETMEVADAPRFHPGDKDILFVQNNGSQFVPLVGIMHGRFHVRRNAAGAEVVTDDVDRPVRNLKRLGREALAASGDDVDLTPADFKAAIKQKVEASRTDAKHLEQ